MIQEVTPAGALVWSWDTLDHIPVTEIATRVGPRPTSRPMTSTTSTRSEPTAQDRVIISYRHLDAVFDVDKTTGQIVYKLGGSSRPESLSVVNDPVLSGSGFGGQHDARVLPDGTLSDPRQRIVKGRAPRALRYQIDLTSTPHTATLVEQVTDPAVPVSSVAAVPAGSPAATG